MVADRGRGVAIGGIGAVGPLSDTLALGTAAPDGSHGAVQGSFHYRRLRGCGSAALILGSLLSGQAIGHFGIVVIGWLNAVLLAVAAFTALGVPQILATHSHARATASQARGVGMLLRLPLYRKMVCSRLGDDLKLIERDLARTAVADERVKCPMTIPAPTSL